MPHHTSLLESRVTYNLFGIPITPDISNYHSFSIKHKQTQPLQQPSFLQLLNPKLKQTPVTIVLITYEPPSKTRHQRLYFLLLVNPKLIQPTRLQQPLFLQLLNPKLKQPTRHQQLSFLQLVNPKLTRPTRLQRQQLLQLPNPEVTQQLSTSTSPNVEM